MAVSVKRFAQLVEIIEDYHIGRIVDQIDCEIFCGRGLFRECKYLRDIYGLKVCVKDSAKRDSRILL